MESHRRIFLFAVLNFLILLITTAPVFGYTSLKGSKQALIIENHLANRDNLDRISSDKMLKQLQKNRRLVPLPQTKQIKIDRRLQSKFRWCRPWVPPFLVTFAVEYYKRFHTPLQVNSAIRTLEYQIRLQYTNPNAASPYGPTASTHPTGATIDIAKKKMTPSELTWVRHYLGNKMANYKIHVIEEFHQAVFHIMVAKKSL